jgi:hypothetical protein
MDNLKIHLDFLIGPANKKTRMENKKQSRNLILFSSLKKLKLKKKEGKLKEVLTFT